MWRLSRGVHRKKKVKTCIESKSRSVQGCIKFKFDIVGKNVWLSRNMFVPWENVNCGKCWMNECGLAERKKFCKVHPLFIRKRDCTPSGFRRSEFRKGWFSPKCHFRPPLYVSPLEGATAFLLEAIRNLLP